jgi:hypothetical protein
LTIGFETEEKAKECIAYTSNVYKKLKLLVKTMKNATNN